MIQAVRHFLIRLLGGHAVPVERLQRVAYERVEYRKGRPLDAADWEKLATMYSWGEVFFRFLAKELDALDEEEGRLRYAAEFDREAVGIRVRRAVIRDLLKLCDTAAARVVEDMTEKDAAKQPREKGLNNHGK